MEEFSKLLILVLLGLTMMPLHNPEKEEENPKENTLHLLSRGGTVPQSCCCSYGNTQQLLTCGELAVYLARCLRASLSSLETAILTKQN